MVKDDKSKLDKETTRDSSSKIDAIKQLIFGENIQEYDHEFEAVKQDILNKKKELESLIDEVKTELLQNMDNLSTDINIRMTELESKIADKTEVLEDKALDRRFLGELFIKLGKNIGN